MGYLRKRHFPDVLCYDVASSISDASCLVGLVDSHIAAREVGDEYSEGYRNEEQWLEVLDDAEVEEHEGKQIHYYILTIRGDDVAERRHVVQVFEYLFHLLFLSL